LRQNVASAISQIDEKLSLDDLSEMDEGEKVNVLTLFRETLHQCYNFGFEVLFFWYRIDVSYPYIECTCICITEESGLAIQALFRQVFLLCLLVYRMPYFWNAAITLRQNVASAI